MKRKKKREEGWKGLLLEGGKYKDENRRKEGRKEDRENSYTQAGRERRGEFGINPNSKQREKEQEISIYMYMGENVVEEAGMVDENSNI